MESTSGASRSATADLTSSRFQKTVCLYDWWLTKATEGFEGSRLAVGGVTSQGYPNKSKHSCTRQVQRVFTSSPIIKRHDAFSLETSDGICVVIKGLINKDRTMGNGFSSEIFNNFVFGFPPQWKECCLKYMGDQSVDGFASPQEGLEKSMHSSLNKESPVNHSKVVSEERHESQILCSHDVPEVTFDVEQEKSIGDVMNLDCDRRRNSKRLSQPSTEGSYPTCDIEPGLNCGDVMNQDEDCERNSNTLSKPPIEPGIAISSPQQRNAQRSSYNKSGRKKQSNHSKVVREERHESQILEECSQDVPEVTFDAEQEQSIGDVMNLDGDRRRKSKRLSQPSTEGSYPTCDIEPGLNCGDVMNQNEDCERNSNTLSKPPIEPGIAISLPQQRNAQRSSYNKTRRKKQSNRSKVVCEERVKTQVLKECSKHVPKAAIDEGVAEEGKNGPCLIRKGSTKQATPNSKIKRKISFESPRKSATEEAKESKTKISPDGSSFKRSRSGRLLIPQMEYWRNQAPVYDRDRSITGILEDSTVTPLRGSRSEPPRKRR